MKKRLVTRAPPFDIAKKAAENVHGEFYPQWK